MIGFAVVAVRRWIGPREVLQAAPLRMRVQFWLLVVSGVFLASVPVVAQRGESVPATASLPSWIPFLGLVLAAIGWSFYAGSIWQQFDALKRRMADTDAAVDKRFLALEAVVVRKDRLDDKLELMNAKIDQLHELLKRSDREWRDSLHGSKE